MDAVSMMDVAAVAESRSLVSDPGGVDINDEFRDWITVFG